MKSCSENTEKFRALKAAIHEGMDDVEAGRIVPWNLKEFLKLAHARKSAEPK